MKKHNVYLASGWFDTKSMSQVTRLEETMEKNNITYFSPRKETCISPSASMEDRKKCFSDNIQGILDADFILANTSWNERSQIDAGVLVELGVAIQAGVPVIVYCETLPKGASINLMISQASEVVCLNEIELEEFFLNKESKVWEGEIE